MPSLVNGLGGDRGFGEGSLTANDDGSTLAIDITSVFGPGGINYFGVHYTTLFVNNNGNITFGGRLSEYIGGPIGAAGLTRPIIAAYWFDIDTRGSSGPGQVTPGGTSTGSNLVYYDLDATTRTFTATWDDVGYYSRHAGAASANAFQIQLIDFGGGDFDIVFTYEAINQSTSDTNDGPGEAPRAGYSAANGTGVEITGSGDYTQSLLLDTSPGNTGEVGIWRFQVRSGMVSGGGGGPPPPPPEPLHAVSFGLDYVPLLHEGDTGVTPFDITIVRSGDLDNPSTVHWEIITADPGDFAPGQPLSGDVVFGPGQTRIVVPVSVQGDHTFEEDDFFRFALTQATHGTQTFNLDVSVMDFIINDDPATFFALAGPSMRPEGQVGATPFEFVVVRTGDLRQASEVQWRLEPGTANAADFADDQALTGIVTFAPGAAQAVITIAARGDTQLEPDEDFTVRLISGRTGSIVTPINLITTGTILDDDSRLTLLVAGSGSLVLPEGDSGTTAFNFSVMRVGDLSLAADIPYAIAFPSGGASAADLQSPLNGMISFAAGASAVILTVLVVGDILPEAHESFSVMLGGGSYNTQVLNGVIINDDKVAVASIGSAPPSAPADDVSLFLQQLAGGGLWSDFGPL